MADSTVDADQIIDVRTLIPDTDAIYGTAANEYLFSDDQISRFFRLGALNPFRAAGLAMIAVGNSEAMIQKVVVTQDLQTNGSVLQATWRQAGAVMLARADAMDKEPDYAGFDIIDFEAGWLISPPELTEPPTVWG